MHETSKTTSLPDWLQREFDEQDDPKVTVSLTWLRAVLEKAGMEMPKDIEDRAH